MATPTERYPYGFRTETVTRTLKNGETRQYQIKRARGPPRERKRQQLREAIPKLSADEVDELLECLRRLQASSSKPSSSSESTAASTARPHSASL